MEEAIRALHEQQRQDHNAIVQLNLLVTEQAKAVEAQRKWNEDNSRRVLAMEGAIQVATVESNRHAREKADELPKALGDIEAKINQRIDQIENFSSSYRGRSPERTRTG